MLTDLNFLNPGQLWPPPAENERLNQYNLNRLIFEGKHDVVYAEQFKRIERIIGNFQNVVSYAVICNFQKLISLKVADLLLGEEPIIQTGDTKSNEQAAIKNISDNGGVNNISYQVALDLSRYGDGLFYIYKDKDTGLGKIDVTQPSIWFPVVDPSNLKRIQYHVLAWTYNQVDDNIGLINKILNGKSQLNKHLKVQIHYRGNYEERDYILKENKIVQQFGESIVVQTGLDDFAIVPVANVLTSDRIHGMDDYMDLDNILSEIEVRLSQIAKILDRHADPSVQGPASALQQDPETGEWHLKMGNYFSRDSNEDPPVEYLVWDASLQANFTMLEKLINILYTISEMGPSILSAGQLDHSSGTAISGTAIKLRMVSPLAKVRRVAARFKPALIKSYKLCSQLGGEGIINLSKTTISVTFQDGLPKDDLELAKIMQIRTGNKATISQIKAIQMLDDMTEENAEKELEAIREDDNLASPLSNGNNPFANSNVIPPEDPPVNGEK
ncbi:phage portal protein [Clostridium pasteurianum]|uniref:Phage portal protein, SPP1 Gp6 n=1 Tax=Clostridium pasteurianum BC1 TaxID=86416 RepID=R4K482_CLOPA|nr:phage portal protein [Clostridium pasteurianum]AGK97398.1 Phage portal protein, SPP1 Gp6 [Clostridium pasteurianum BC1]